MLENDLEKQILQKAKTARSNEKGVGSLCILSLDAGWSFVSLLVLPYVCVYECFGIRVCCYFEDK